MPNELQRIWEIEVSKGHGLTHTTWLTNEQLTDKHVNLFTGELIRLYLNTPPQAQEKFKEWLIKAPI